MPTTTTKPIDLVLDRLGYRGQRGGDKYKCHCPAHDDSIESLSVSVGKDGKVLLKCHAGCEIGKVVAELGLKMADLFPASSAKKPTYPPKHKAIVATYDYRDEHGKLLYQGVRYKPKEFRQRRPDDTKGWVWNLNGVPRVLYKLPELLETTSDKWVFIVEGEKDVDNLCAHGLTATTNAQGAAKWESHFNEWLKGRRVCILPDNDDPGRKHAHNVAQQLLGIADTVRLVELEPLPLKGDVSDWLEAGGNANALLALADAAPDYVVPTNIDSEAAKHSSWPYVVEEGRLVQLKRLDELIVPIPIADLEARIVGEIIAEDGTKTFVIEGKGVRGGKFTVEILDVHFGDTAKLVAEIEAKSARDGVRAGMRPHLGPAIKAMTGETWTERRFRRTGWADRGFLIPGRVSADIRLDLHNKLRYEVTDSAELDLGLAALPDLIDAPGAERGTILLASFLQAPLARLAGWENERYGVFVVGRSGTLKTATTQAYMTLYGPRFAEDSSLITLGDGSTNNAIVGLAAAAHDLPILLDNYKPNTGRGQHGLVDLIHRIFEGGDKARMNRNAELRETKPNHTWPVFTGEDLPAGDPASLARLLIIHFEKPEAEGRDSQALTRAQAATKHLCAVGASWIDWLESDEGRQVVEKHAAQMQDIRNETARILLKHNPTMVNPSRVATNLATNSIVWAIALEHPKIGPIIAPFTAAYKRGQKAVAMAMSNHTEQGLEATRYLHALRELLATGRAVLLASSQTEVTKWKAKTQEQVEKDRLQDRVIGWIDGNGGAYLYPTVARKLVAQTLGDDLSAMSDNTLYLQFAELGAIRRGKNKATICKRLGGILHRVLHLLPSALSAGGETAD